ncbi:MAG: hypothetical protein C4525_10335 [Desulfarculus sp.]|jgi:uncharacterized OB-fold protein|nr:MAG: hypothetical protein C4525_10335 [Desulfarculus sp.]
MDKQKIAGDKVPALPDLFQGEAGGVRLRSARCGTCGTCFFPEYHEQHRPGCSREGVEKILLNRIGKLASYTVQHYMPPPPFRTEKDITPYPIGMVEFPEGIQVVGIMVDYKEDDLVLGREVETTTFTLYRDDKGQEIVTWAFRPKAH